MAYVVVTPPATEPVSLAEVMQYCRIDESNQEPAPGAINVSISSGAGNVDNGIHRYLCTFVTPEGETQAGAISAPVTIADKTVNGKVSLSAIPIGGSRVTARKIYRTAAAGSTYLLLSTIADNTTTTYTDNTADVSLGAQAPADNTTIDPLINILITSARVQAEQILHRFLITQTVDRYLDKFESEIKLPPIQSVTSITYTDLNGDEQTFATNQYVVDAVSKPARITLASSASWPSVIDQVNAVKIRFVAGYGNAAAVPSCIKNWMLIRIKQAYDNRDAVNVGNTQIMEFPYSYIDGLLDPERVWGL